MVSLPNLTFRIWFANIAISLYNIQSYLWIRKRIRPHVGNINCRCAVAQAMRHKVLSARLARIAPALQQLHVAPLSSCSASLRNASQCRHSCSPQHPAIWALCRHLMHSIRDSGTNGRSGETVPHRRDPSSYQVEATKPKLLHQHQAASSATYSFVILNCCGFDGRPL